MTEQTTSSKKRKTVDWNKKCSSDSERIKQRAQKKNLIPTEIDSNIPASIQKVPLASGQPLLRLRQKIREIYDEDEENDIINQSYFNIELVEDMDQSQKEKIQLETIRQTKEQELTSKMNIIMSTALAADKAGLKTTMTKDDANRATSAEYSPQKLQKETLHDKIEKPLNLKGEINNSQISKTVKGIKRAQKYLSADSLKDMDAKDLPELAEETKPQDLAQTVLKKTGRKGPKKSLFEIAEGLNKYKDIDDENQKND